LGAKARRALRLADSDRKALHSQLIIEEHWHDSQIAQAPLAHFRTPPKTFFKNRLYFCCNTVRKLGSLTVSRFTIKGIRLCQK
jgi:hypothetical protein